MRTMTTTQTTSIDAIVTLMRDNWDLPADCNEGELYTYAEHLVDRIRAGDGSEALEIYLRAIQIEKLDMSDSPAYRVIARCAAGGGDRAAGGGAGGISDAAIGDEAALPAMPKDADPHDGSPV
jgi:hypothetical protein